MRGETTNRTFDELAGGLARGTLTRGKALRLMGAALVGSALASLGIGGVAGADNLCKPAEKKCRKDAQCCSRNCDDSGTCAACPVGSDLVNGICLKRCTAEGCPEPCIGCFTHSETGVGYCGGFTAPGSDDFCANDSDCDPGHFCVLVGSFKACRGAC